MKFSALRVTIKTNFASNTCVNEFLGPKNDFQIIPSAAPKTRETVSVGNTVPALVALCRKPLCCSAQDLRCHQAQVVCSSVVCILACRVDMVQVPGKRTRPVPILIMPVVREAMDVIVDVRRQHNINSENPCFFHSDTAGGYIDHCRVLRELSRDARVKRPELIRSTKLRKYMATVMQVFGRLSVPFLS